MLTERELRLINHRVSPEPPPYEVFGPYHTFRRADSEALIPGSLYTISFVMLPTSVLIPKGYALRIAIAGHDGDTFDRYPLEGDPTYTIHRNRNNASHITLPVMWR